MSSKIVLTGSGTIVYGNAWSSGNAPWTAGFSQGATSLTMGTLNSGSLFSAGQIIELTQCFTGETGPGCTGGALADNGGVYLCGNSTTCANQNGNGTLQGQTVQVTSVTGTGPYTVNFTPALKMANWSSAGGGALVSWIGAGSIASPSGIGLEDVTVDMTGVTGNFGVQYSYVYASWMKGVRIVGSGSAESVSFGNCLNSLIFNTMFDNYSYTRGDLSLSLQWGGDSDNLMLNNILLHGLSFEGLGSNQGDVVGYSLVSQTHTLYYEANPFQHTPGTSFTLYEGLETGHITDDDTWGSANLNTFFRNYENGWDPPYLLSSQCAALSCVAMKVDGEHRFANVIGNVIGSAFLTNYQATLSTPTNGVTNNAAYRWSADTNDPIVLLSVMRWGNVTSIQQSSDTPANSGIRFVSSEVPSSINSSVNALCTGAGTPYTNCTGSGTGTIDDSFYYAPVPSNDNLPCSFFLGVGSSPCSPLYSGGTGLSWWKVCKTWATFPTSCSASQTQPFPIAGPELTSGPYVSGYAYDLPAEVAFVNLPIDTAYQNSFSITGSSWSNTCTNQPSGTYACETLTVSGMPSGSAHIMGGFQITGASGCNTSGAPGGSTEFVMTGSSVSGSTGTIVYALASNPGSCTGGTMLFPDVREFDEQVYEADPAGTVTNTAPCVTCILSLLDWTEMLR